MGLTTATTAATTIKKVCFHDRIRIYEIENERKSDDREITLEQPSQSKTNGNNNNQQLLCDEQQQYHATPSSSNSFIVLDQHDKRRFNRLQRRKHLATVVQDMPSLPFQNQNHTQRQRQRQHTRNRWDANITRGETNNNISLHQPSRQKSIEDASEIIDTIGTSSSRYSHTST